MTAVTYDEMVAAMVLDLRRQAAFLLERGREEGVSRALRDFAPAPLTSIAGALHAADVLARSTPKLLAESMESVLSTERMERTQRPARAHLSRAPWAFERSDDGDWTPRYWLRPAVVETTSPDALRWLVFIVERVASELQELRERFATQLDELRSVRQGLQSSWSDDELARLDETAQRLDAATERLDRARRVIELRAGGPVFPRERIPRPFPRGATWQRLRRLVRHWLDPALSLESHLDRTLSSPVDIADLPFLYERWCALQLLAALADLGWTPDSDSQAVWAVFLGGRVELSGSGSTEVELWIEPRIGPNLHPCGLRTTERSEQTPDLVLNVTTHDSVESIVLDPTLALAPDHLETKGRYARTLVRAEPRHIAGVPVIKHPRRAWAIAPLDTHSCRLFGVTETVGVIPLRPGTPDPRPLQAFLRDLLVMLP